MAKQPKKVETKEPTGHSFNDKALKILENFASINPSLIIEADKFSVINNSKSVVGFYQFDEPFNFEPIGLYECSEFLQAYKAIDKATFEVKDKYVQINGKSDKLKYFTTAQELLPKVPNVSDKFTSFEASGLVDLEFSLSADKLALLNKMAGILKCKFIFFETDGDTIRLTVADELESSANSYDITVEEGIKMNKLGAPVKINLADFKILPGDYEIKLAPKISKWSNVNGVDYFIGTAI